jgi:hypothetical protein
MRLVIAAFLVAVSSPAYADEVWSCTHQKWDDPKTTVFFSEIRINDETVEFKDPCDSMPTIYRILANDIAGVVAASGHAFINPHETVVNGALLLLKRERGDSGGLLISVIDMNQQFSRQITGSCRKV